MNIIDAPTLRKLPQRTKRPRAVVIHTTGEKDLDKILDWYHRADGYQPNYMIETTGTVRRIADEGLVAYHCKIDPAEAHLYQLGYGTWSQWTWHAGQPMHLGGEWIGYRHWREQWHDHGYESPLELVTGDHPNYLSVGVELQQPIEPTPINFTGEQYVALAELLVDITGRNSIDVDRAHLLTHADCSPMRRCSAAGPWDPPASFSYSALWKEIGKAPR